MTDALFPPPADDGEALSAYLAGQLGEAEARALQTRLDSEPALAAQLDALAEALVSLGGYDEVDVPAGFDERLGARLAAERDDHAGAVESETAVPPPVDLAARRRRRQGAWLGIGTAAAVLAIGAVMAGTMMRGMSDGGGESAAGDAALESAEGGSSAQEDFAAGGGGAAAGQELSGPVVRDSQVAIADEAALQRRFSTAPEAQGLLGVPVADARQLQRRYRASLEDQTLDRQRPDAPVAAAPEASVDDGEAEAAPPTPQRAPDTAVSGQGAGPSSSAGAPPRVQRFSVPGTDRCLAEIMRGQSPLVPVRVESLRYQGRPAVAYLFVGASRGSKELDRAELWVVRPDTCRTVVFQEY